MYYVYVLKSLANSFHYIGHTEAPVKRIHIHNSGKVRSTKAHRPFKIIYTEEYATRDEAQKREYYLKRAEGNIWLRNELKRRDLW